ncbi:MULTISPECIES: RloB domain-containing protein [Cysteiniphilum]|uniref:RloB domain-containing protein n=1 Tax=Cysteiniphilum TaxID=2056696 RepID=UPI0017855DDE|nr:MULTISPECIES: RloB domain-containing protein [Cysteiniphilum]
MARIKRYTKANKRQPITHQFLFFVEGKTEEIYIKSIFKQLEIDAKITFPMKGNDKANIQNIENRVITTDFNDSQSVIVVIDGDRDQQKIKEFSQKKKIFQSAKSFLIIVSVPNFERWLTLHYTEDKKKSIKDVCPKFEKTNTTVVEDIAQQHQIAIDSSIKLMPQDVRQYDNAQLIRYMLDNTALQMTNFYQLFEVIERSGV